MKYITRHGMILTEEELEEVYRNSTFTIFSEQDYKAWKYDKMEAGTIRFAEEGIGE